MSFSSRVKSEIIGKGLPSAEEKAAFLSGFIRATGSIIEVGGDYGFEFSVESEKTADYALFLMKSLFGYESGEITGGDTRITVECVGRGAVEILENLHILVGGNLNVKLGGLYEKDSEKKAFVKGVFVGSGNVTVPVKALENRSARTGYHLEFVFFGYEPALEFSAFLAGAGILTKLTERKDNYIIYIKSSEDIKDFLAYAGAPKAVLEITEIMVEREIVSNANRRTNCDLANVNKQTDAAGRLISAIEEIESTIGLGALSVPLRIVAEARRNYPEDTLQELAERLNISKSCLNHRLRKILEIEKNLTV